MKKFYLLLTLIVITTIQVANAQAPQGIPYQAVARDNAGNLIKNQPISLRFSIHDGSANGAVVYSETHAVTTDALGLFSVNIGGGTSSGTLADINWGSGAKFTQVELDVTGGTNFADMGTTQMMSVPYALYAGSSAAAPSVFQTTTADPNNISNVNSGNVGIGTDAPTEKLDVNGNLKVRQSATINGTLNVEQAPWDPMSPFFPPPAQINLSGRMGIGTNSPSALLNIVGGDRENSLRIESGNAGVALVSTREYQIFTRQQGDLAFYDQTAEQEPNGGYPYRMIINPVGKVGIGNQSPTEQLDVTGNIKSNQSMMANSFVKAGGQTNEYLMADGSTSIGPDLSGYTTTAALDATVTQLSSQIAAENVRATTAENNLQAQTTMLQNGVDNLQGQVQTNTTGITNLQTQIGNVQSNFVTTADNADHIHNTNSGNVGIGTDAPTEKLDVAGNVKLSGTINGLTIGENNSGSNIAIGPMALNAGLSNYSIAIGTYSMINTHGVSNTAVGGAALAGDPNGSSSSYNTALGANAMTRLGNTIGNNTGIGYKSLDGTTTGGLNTAVGVFSLGYNTTGDKNTGLGVKANVASGDLTNATAIGFEAIVDESNKIQLGNTDVTSVNTSGTYTGAGFKTPNGTNTEYLMADGSTSTGGSSTSMGSIGVSSTANGATITSGVLSLTPADGTNGGIVTSSAQTFGGKKTFADSAVAFGFRATDSVTTKGFRATGTATANSFVKAGGNSSQYLMADGSTSAGTVATTMGAIGASSTANGGTITSGVLSLTPADGTNGGIVTSSAQTFGGDKSFTNDINIQGVRAGKGTGSNSSSVLVGNGLGNNTTGINNTSVGSQALFYNTTGGNNSSYGYRSLIFNTTGGNNSAYGHYSLLYNTTGGNNSAYGYQSLLYNTGNSNTANGYGALLSNTTGSNNTALGYNADVSTGTLTNATAIGNGAIVNASNKIQLGNTSVTSVNTSGTYTGAGFVKAGGTSSQYLMADGSTSAGTVATTMGTIGASSTANGATISSGVLSLAPADGTNGGIVTSSAQTFAGKKTFADSAVALGFRATDSVTTKGFRATGTATANSFVKAGGTSSQYLMADGSTSAGTVATTMGTIGASSTANGGTISSGVLSLAPADGTNGGIVTSSAQTFGGDKSFTNDINIQGVKAGKGTGDNSFSVLVGNGLGNNTTGINNTSVGNNSMVDNTTGAYNAAFGDQSLQYNTTGQQNTALGHGALLFNTTGSYNVGIGSAALLYNDAGSSNIAIGHLSMYNNESGQNNTAIGDNSGVAAGNLNNSTAIGANAVVDASNKIQLGNTDVTTVNTSGTYTGAGFRATDSVTTKGLRATGTAGADSVSTRAFKATGTARADSVSTRALKTTGNAIVGGNLISFNPTNAAINATATATADNIISGYITSTSAAVTIITLPTATAIATALGTVSRGTQLEFTVDNVSGAQTVTIVLGTGITAIAPVITGTNTLTVSIANIGRFRLVFTSATAAKIIRVF